MKSLFDDDGCYITDEQTGVLVVSSGISARTDLYVLTALPKLPAISAFSATSSGPEATAYTIPARLPTLETWHHRLGHAGLNKLVQMINTDMVAGMNTNLSSEPAKCQSCIQGKQTRSSVPKEREGVKAEDPLHTVHIDLIGPQSVLSASSFHYVMNIIGNFSSYSWSIGLANKLEAFPKLVRWVSTVELELMRKIVIMRFNNGELKSAKLDVFVASKGIRTQWTAPHTSAQNGRVEHVNHTLQDSVHTM